MSRIALLALLLLTSGCISVTETVVTEVMDDGIVRVESGDGVEVTYARLLEAIEAAGPLRVLAEIDHTANAASVGLELRPTRVVLFGNPRAGTPLMQAENSLGLDLPQRMAVVEAADGRVFVLYNDPMHLARRHGITGQGERLQTVAAALAGLAAKAAGE